MFDTVELPIKCPHCGQKALKTIASLKADNRVACACGASFDASELLRAFDEAKKAVDDFSDGGPKNLNMRF